MPNLLLRTVKRMKTVKNIVASNNYTVFEVTTYGYRNDNVTVSSNVIQNREFQIFEGTFYNYQLPLRENQKAVKI